MLDVVRIRVSETSSHLLGRAALGQMRPHILPQPGIPGVSAVVAADGLGWPPVCDRWMPDRDGPAWRCAPTRGSRCWGLRPNTLAIVRSEWPWANLKLKVGVGTQAAFKPAMRKL